ncbi:kinase-like domain-containing protein [Lyophyllum atratum]|nr:kinase-like domain-containing protein [Lyophyllum atratum]
MPLGLKLHDDALAHSVLKVTDELVVKVSHISEAKAMEFIEKHTTVRVPHVHLVFRRGFEVYIVMDYVRGDSLDKTWHLFDNATRELVLAQLHDYIRQLRTIDVGHPASPGPLNGDRCRGRWFGFYNAGPFKTHSALVGWLNRKIELARNPALTPFSTEHELVFSHQDLAPRNFILDGGKQLWIIDWERAGWYPAYFEYANVAFEHHCDPESFIDRILPVLGDYDKEYKSLDGIRWVLDSMPFAK